jgi:hypothetical protein
MHSAQKAVIADIKGILQSAEIREQGAVYWRL